ncbi:CPBP family glutamic-type intramembrane protease [Sulfobacillus thermosulfidooxidans]|uniref:CPBP family glutamic-type intramembrane protease n=1 Tax=Sulfobacillus thermosulfidooxidans TaxID=28034 RepID=UPI0011127A53|nr:CPBP family glutamic-type intramembrane protease [Sulfobacillus thermosulfidooxidans]
MIRRVTIYMPLLAPILWKGIPPLAWFVTPLAYVLAIGASLLGLAIQIRNIMPFFDRAVALLLRPMPKSDMLWAEYSVIGSAVLEEVFYRFGVPKSDTLIGLVLSAGLFSIPHAINRQTRKSMTWKSYVTLGVLGGSWFATTTISHSLLPAILGHLVYNSPKSISLAWRYRVRKSSEIQNASV